MIKKYKLMNTLVNKFKLNWKSGITVSLISIPLSISLAVASGSTPLAGIITAIWAGLIASIFGGSNFNIIGPTGALSGIIAMFAINNGAHMLPTLSIITGILVLIAYILKLERYLVFIPSSVIHGFTLGVAFIIGLGQLNYALGLQGLTKHERFINNLYESAMHFGALAWPTVIVFLIFLSSLLILRRLIPKLPGAILLSPVGIALGYIGSTGHLPFKLQTLGDIFGNIGGSLFQLPQIFFNLPLVQAALTVALVAILETMLSAKIADGITKTKHNERKEMLGLSLANIGSGLAGGIPCTAALARTSLNIKNGATDKISATINSLSVAIISLLLLHYFKFMPMAVIAAILTQVAIQMVETEHFIRYYRFDKLGFAIAILVALITVCIDPIVGILLGTAIVLILFMEKLSRGQFDLFMNRFDQGQIGMISGEKIKAIEERPDILLYSFKGMLMYVNSRAHISRFETNLTDYSVIILRLREVYFIDLDGVEALDEIISLAINKKQKVLITGVNQWINELLEKNSHKYRELKAQDLVFDKATQALSYLGVDQQKLQSN